MEEQLTPAEYFEQYAQKYEVKANQHLGDEWNRPAYIGLDVPAEQIVEHLDQHVFAPFIGQVDVILEIGAGGGRYSEILLLKCQRLILSDIALTMVDYLRQRYAANHKVEYLLLDGLGLSPTPAESVDLVFSYGVFLFLPHWDFYRYLTEIYRVLKPGGQAIIHHANTFSKLGWKRFQDDLPKSLNRHQPPMSQTLMTPEIMNEFARRAGLVLEDCVTHLVKRDGISLLSKQE